MIAEPEIFQFEITPQSKFVVLASDGIWEFLSNEQVMNMIIPFYLKNDSEGACERLVKESVACWKREDDVVDDITIIIIFFSK